MKIHPTAIVEDGAQIGEGTEIGPYAVIYSNVTVGPNCRIHSGAVLGDTPQDLAFKNVQSYVRIGANCVIREHVTIHRGTKEGTATVVGDDCMLMANSHLGHNVVLGNKVILANAVMLAGYVEVGDGAFFAGGAGIHQFVRIGRLSMIAGLTGIGKDVPPFCMTLIHCFNTVAGLNVVGMRRAGMTPSQRAEVKAAFGILYRSGLNVSQAVERIRAENPGALAQEFADFIDASKRGICAFAGRDESVSES